MGSGGMGMAVSGKKVKDVYDQPPETRKYAQRKGKKSYGTSMSKARGKSGY